MDPDLAADAAADAEPVGVAVGERWEAPLTAYRLKGLVASHRATEAEELWKRQDKLAQADILSALAAQARHGSQVLSVTRGVDGMIIDVGKSMQLELCSEAARAFAVLLTADPGPWQLPECGHCRAMMATSLIHLGIRLAVKQGMTPQGFALVCLTISSVDAPG